MSDAAEDIDNTSRATVEHASASDPIVTDEEAKRIMRRRSRRSFLVGGVAAATGFAGWRWLNHRPEIDGVLSPLRRAHEFNEGATQAYFRESRLAPTFARSLASAPRVNGEEGMPEGFDATRWRLQVVGVADPKRYPQYVDDVYYDSGDEEEDQGDASTDQLEGDDTEQDGGGDTTGGDAKGGSKDNQPEQPTPVDETAQQEVPEPGLLMTLDDIKRLPRYEMTTELKCIEGWSTVVNWAGARLSDFMEQYQPATRDRSAPDVRNRPDALVRYVSLETPDAGYYVGLDMPSALHPQTLLCYEMNGQPLAAEHGAPLRLVTPLKYGIKHLKRIGKISFTDTRPADFWAEQGYDWYSGH